MNLKNSGNEFIFIPLPEPIPITQQVWPEGTIPIVTTRTMTFMHESFIRDCIEGILMQKTTFPVQVLIHDDASTDGTAAIVREYELQYPQLIKAYYQKENSFTKPDKRARRAEFRSWSRGKYIALCEGDDYWTDPLKLQKQVEFLEANEEYVMCYHDVKVIDENGILLMESQLHTEAKRDASKEDLIYGGFWAKTLTLCFRNVYNDMNYPKEMKFVLNGDTFLISLLGNFGKGKWMGDEIKPGVYRIHSGGIWSTKNKIEKMFDHVNTFLWISRYYNRINEKVYAEKWLSKMLNTANSINTEWLNNAEKNEIEKKSNIFDKIKSIFNIRA
jgi:glycosyltransferase involved in cell wall biosynthesis